MAPFLCSVIAPSVTSADHAASVTDGGSGHADTTNSGSTWAASQAHLRDHAVRLRKRRWRYCLRRSCDGYDKASNSDQSDHSSPPLFTVHLGIRVCNHACRSANQPRIARLTIAPEASGGTLGE